MWMAPTLTVRDEILLAIAEVDIQNCVFRNNIEHMYSERQTSDTWSLGLIEQFNVIQTTIQAYQTIQCVRGFHILDLATTFNSFGAQMLRLFKII